MRIMKTIVLCALFMKAGLAFAHDVKTDYDRAADFDRYRTFMWVGEPETVDPFTRQQIFKGVNAQLEAKGLRLVTSNADLTVSAVGLRREEHSCGFFYATLAGG